jgi:hypothetical protein
MQRADWLPESAKTASPTNPHIMINIRGLVSRALLNPTPVTNTTTSLHFIFCISLQMYETPTAILKQDPKSLLGQLCSPNPPVLPDPDGGFFYFDRDWYVHHLIGLSTHTARMLANIETFALFLLYILCVCVFLWTD